MTWWHRLIRRRKHEDDLEKELRFHLDQHTDDLIAEGYSPAEARRQARLALGPKAARPLAGPLGQGRTGGSDGPVLEKPAEVVGQIPGSSVARVGALSGGF